MEGTKKRRCLFQVLLSRPFIRPWRIHLPGTFFHLPTSPPELLITWSQQVQRTDTAKATTACRLALVYNSPVSTPIAHRIVYTTYPLTPLDTTIRSTFDHGWGG